MEKTERLHFHFSLSCIGEGNGNPLQCSCLENPSDGGALWAAVYGVTQGRTRLKRLSSSSSSKVQGKPLEDFIKACHDIGSEPYKMQLLTQAIMGLKQQASQQVKCFSCGKRGHVQKNRKTSKNTPNKTTPTNEKKPGLCPRCNKGHHWANQCRSKFHKNGSPLSGNWMKYLLLCIIIFKLLLLFCFR